MSSRTKTLAAADLADADAIKTSLASSTSAADYQGAALNGASVSDNVAAPQHGGSSPSGFSAYPTVTTNLALDYGGGITDTSPTIAAQAHDVSPEAILAATTAAITVYMR
jgi:hypothetical protein